MDRLELHVDERRLEQRRCRLGLVVEEPLERAETLRERVGRRRHERRVARPGAADPHLRAPDLAGRLAAAARMPHQRLVDVPQQAHGQRQPVGQERPPPLQRGGAAAHLARVLHRNDRLLLDLVEEEVGQRGLRALDLRGEHRLLAHEAVSRRSALGRCAVRASSRPRARRASSKRLRSAPDQAIGGCGGSGAGTKAWNGSPVETLTYLPGIGRRNGTPPRSLKQRRALF
jgi:hypothetical protein